MCNDEDGDRDDAEDEEDAEDEDEAEEEDGDQVDDNDTDSEVFDSDEDEKDAPDSIEEFLSFLNTLTSDIEVSLIQLCMHCRVGSRFEFKIQGHPY